MPTGHALPLGPSFGLREPNGWTPRIYSGSPIPAVRPEQSDHVPWADCPQGLSSTLVRFAHPSGKKPLIAHFDSGARNVARNGIGQLSPALGARSCSPISAVKMGGPFSLHCLSPLCSPTGGVEHTQMAVLGMCLCCLDGFAAQENRLDFSSVIGASHTQIVPLGIIPHRNLDIFVTQKASVGSNPRWLFLRAGGPVARRRSVLFNEQGIHTRPASREARCRAAVKPKPSHFSSMPLRASAVTGAGL